MVIELDAPGVLHAAHDVDHILLLHYHDDDDDDDVVVVCKALTTFTLGNDVDHILLLHHHDDDVVAVAVVCRT